MPDPDPDVLSLAGVALGALVPDVLDVSVPDVLPVGLVDACCAPDPDGFVPELSVVAGCALDVSVPDAP